MSGIFGIARFDRQSLVGDEIRRMCDVMAPWGPDAVDSLDFDGGALGRCLLHDTPEARYDQLPRMCHGGAAVFSAEARLDNREDLCEALGVDAPARGMIADGELARLAYERWGENCPSRLLGDWSLAVWHPRDRRLFLARDHHGNTALYYYIDNQRVAFASDRQALLALPGVSCRLNELYLAQMLVGSLAFQGERTAFREIWRLPPAHALSVSPANSRVWRYWRLEDAPEVRLASTDDYAQALYEHLHRAVSARLRTAKPVAVALSSGLDSGAVAVTAGHQLALRGGRLRALTAVPVHPVTFGGELPDEFELAATTARAAGIVDHVRVSAEEISPLDGIERLLEIHAEPGLGAVNGFFLTALCNAARDHVLLTGQTGNAAFSWAGVPTVMDVARSVARGKFREAVRVAADITWRTRLAPLATTRRRRYRMAISGCRASAINESFAREIDLANQLVDDSCDSVASVAPASGRQAQLTLLRPGRQLIGSIWAELGAAYRIAARDPLQDTRLIAFAHGVPNSVWRGPLARWLARAAMVGRLPDAVRLSTRRGRQAADLVQRLNTHRRRLTELLDEIAMSPDAGRVIDLQRMRAVAEQITTAGMSTREQPTAAAVLMMGLSVGLFVARSGRAEPGVLACANIGGEFRRITTSADKK